MHSTVDVLTLFIGAMGLTSTNVVIIDDDVIRTGPPLSKVSLNQLGVVIQ